MRKFIAAIMTAALVGSILIVGKVYSAPNTDFSWTAPTNYVDGTIIPATDILSYTIYCSTTQGGPYNFSYPAGTAESIANVDVGSCVQGIPGTYYFVATSTSTDFGSESTFSNEVSRTYSAVDLGKVPNPPVLISVQ